MKDDQCVFWVHKTYGGNLRYHTQTTGYGRPGCLMYDWTINGRAAVPVLRQALPHFKLKRGQALAALKMQGPPRPSKPMQAKYARLIKQFNQRKIRLKDDPWEK